MSLVSDLITDVRYYINDTESSRFSDAYLLSLIKLATARANRIAQRNGLQFAKKKGALTCTANQAYVDLPADYDVALAGPCLFRDDTHANIPLKTESQWETIISASALANAQIDIENSRINLNGTPTSATALTFYYYPTVATASMTAGSTMPWSGRLDDIIKQYAQMRAMNIDEMDVSYDTQLLADLETQILSAYQPNAPTLVNQSGWMGDME